MSAGAKREWTIVVMMLMSVLAGCAGSSGRYQESYEVAAFKVVFLDQESLHETYATLYRSAPNHFELNGSDTTVRSIHGFFDPITRTLYCSKLDFEVCGHEMHHAVLGAFH